MLKIIAGVVIGILIVLAIGILAGKISTDSLQDMFGQKSSQSSDSDKPETGTGTNGSGSGSGGASGSGTSGSSGGQGGQGGEGGSNELLPDVTVPPVALPSPSIPALPL